MGGVKGPTSKGGKLTPKGAALKGGIVECWTTIMFATTERRSFAFVSVGYAVALNVGGVWTQLIDDICDNLFPSAVEESDSGPTFGDAPMPSQGVKQR